MTKLLFQPAAVHVPSPLRGEGRRERSERRGEGEACEFSPGGPAPRAGSSAARQEAAPTPSGPFPVRDSRKSHAFTLLELLVALALMTLLAGTLYSAMYVGFKAREAGTRALAAPAQMFNAMAMLGQDLENALPPTGVLAGEFTGSSTGPAAGSGSTAPGTSPSSGSPSSSPSGMSGGLSSSNSSLNGTSGGLHADSPDPQAVVLLSFYSTGNNPNPNELGADIRKVEFSLETPQKETAPAAKNPSMSTRVLMRRIYYNLLPAKAPAPREQILCRNIRSLYLRYYDGSLWQDQWDSKSQNDALPAAVEVTLELDRPDAGDDSSPYRMTRVFALPCAPAAANQTAGTTP